MKYMQDTQTDYKTNTEMTKEVNKTPVLAKYRTTEETGCIIQTGNIITDY